MTNSAMPSSSVGVRFEPGTKFACIALPHCRPLRLPAATAVNNQFVVLTESPFEVGNDWRATLGTSRAESYAGSNLFIFASRVSLNPFSKEGENDQLVWAVRAFYYALMMLGTPEHEPGLLLAGGVSDSGPQVLHVQELVRVHVRPLGDHPAVATPLLRMVGRISSGILNVHRHQEFQRVQRGFWTWLGAMRESHLHARLHQFVRAVDSLVASEQGKGRRQFVDRAQTFAGGSEIKKVLGQLYDLRSVEEHFSPWEPVFGLPKGQEAERTGALRAYQTERLAGDVFSRLFTNPELLDRFRKQESIAEFWALTVEQRQGLWGTPINLDVVAKECVWKPELLRQD